MEKQGWPWPRVVAIGLGVLGAIAAGAFAVK